MFMSLLTLVSSVFWLAWILMAILGVGKWSFNDKPVQSPLLRVWMALGSGIIIGFIFSVGGWISTFIFLPLKMFMGWF